MQKNKEKNTAARLNLKETGMYLKRYLGYAPYQATNDGMPLVTLRKLQTIARNAEVSLIWETGSETDSTGFHIFRSVTKDGAYSRINDSLITAQGSPTQGASYEFVDNKVKNGTTYYYKLQDIDNQGNETDHGPVSATPRLFHWLLK